MKSRGFTMVELMSSIGIMSFIILGIAGVTINSLRSFEKSTAELNITQKNAQGMRRVAESLRQAMSVSISSNGKVITYSLPQVSGSTDPVTGEKELISPITSDGITRTFTVADGKLTDSVSSRILVTDISAKDPQEDSTQYNQEYSPFQLTTIGSRRAITITLITAQTINGKRKFTRLKTTTIVRNAN